MEYRTFLKIDTATLYIIMQMATFSTQRKPTQTNRYGKNSEGLSESSLERGMNVPKCQELGIPCLFLKEL